MKTESTRMMALSLVKKQAAAEALAMLYGINTFRFGTSRTLNTFLENIPTMRKHLKNIILPHSIMCIPSPLANWLNLVNLESVVTESETVVIHALTKGGKVNIKDLLHELLPFLRSWHAACGTTADKTGVLDVVGFAKFRDCKDCHPFKHACE